MDALERKRAGRFRYLKALYDRTDGSPSCPINLFDLGAELGFGRDETVSLVEYLANEELLAHIAIGQVGITHRGVVEIEGALKVPEQETQYFPPVVNVINVQTMVGSQIQQAGDASAQHLSNVAIDLLALRAFLDEMRVRSPELALPPAAKGELDAELATLAAQLESPRPKKPLISGALRSVRTIIEGAAGNVAASLLLPKLIQLLGG